MVFKGDRKVDSSIDIKTLNEIENSSEFISGFFVQWSVDSDGNEEEIFKLPNLPDLKYTREDQNAERRYLLEKILEVGKKWKGKLQRIQR